MAYLRVCPRIIYVGGGSKFVHEVRGWGFKVRA